MEAVWTGLRWETDMDLFESLWTFALGIARLLPGASQKNGAELSPDG